MDRKDLQELSKIRLKEANALLKLEMFDGAYYLASYAVECALKACIAKGTQKGDFPDRRRAEQSHTHNLGELLVVARLSEAHAARIKIDPEYSKNWEFARLWSEQSRYKRHAYKAAKELVDAAGDRRHGLIAWLKHHW